MYSLGRASTRGRSLGRAQRQFSAAVDKAQTGAAAPAYNQVKFVSEPVEQVALEVPKFQFFEMPEYGQSMTNVYKNQPMSMAIPEGKTYAAEPLGAEPKIEYSQLENGLKVASIDNGGSSAAVGLFVNAGSRFEPVDMRGLSHMTAMAAYKSTAHLSYLRIAKTLETLGVKADAVAGREAIAYRALLDREYMPIVTPLLVGNILYPRLLQWEINPLVEKVAKYNDGMSDEEKVSDLVHSAAFLNNTLGWGVNARDKDVYHFTGEVIRDYMMQHFSPDKMCLVGVNIAHADLAKWTMRSFVDYNAIPSSNTAVEKPVYTGGERRVATKSGYCSVSIAYHFEGGWSSPDLIALNVYQAALGGASKGFTNEMSAAGSKLAGLVAGGVGSCQSFSNVYSDAGLCGVAGVVAPKDVPAYIESVAGALAGSGTVSAEELARAKGILKMNLACSVESPEKMMEDMGRQMLMSGKVLSAKEIGAKIDAVSAADVSRVASKLLATKPTIVSYGAIEYVPHYDSICSTLSSATPSVFSGFFEKPAAASKPAAAAATPKPAAAPTPKPKPTPKKK